MNGGIGCGDALAGIWALKFSRYSCPSFPAVFSCMRRFCTVATPFTRGTSMEYTLPASAGISSIPSVDELTVMTTFPFKFSPVRLSNLSYKKKKKKKQRKFTAEIRPKQTNQVSIEGKQESSESSSSKY